MKVDKAVCTNDTLEDLSRAIRFEAVFSTLVENKILAIKRECEQKKKTKRSFGRILFGKRIFGDQSGGDGGGSVESPQDLEKGNEKIFVDKKTINKEIEETEFHNEIEIIRRDSEVAGASLKSNELKCCDINNDNDDDDDKSALDNDESSISSKKDHEYKIEIQVLRQHDDISAATNKESTTTDSISVLEPSTSNRDITTSGSCRDIDEIVKDTDQSTTGSEATVKFKTTNRKVRGSRESLHYLDHDRSRLRILEAKSISAQCSPIFPRQKFNDIDTIQQQQQQQQQHQLPQRHTISDHSDNVSALSENVVEKLRLKKLPTVSTKINEKKTNKGKYYSHHDQITHLEYDSIISYHQTNQSSQGFISSFNQLTSSNLPVITTTSKTKNQYCDTIKLKRMTSVTSRTSGGSNSNKFKTKQKNNKRDRSERTEHQHHRHRHRHNDERNEKNRNLDKEILDESDEEYKKRKRKHKRSQRCSDPVLVYPSSSGLQHCILSRPPNQPIQLQYDEDFIYDVSLQLEPDGNGDLVPGRRKHRHRHHRHGKKKRHKPRKVLIHDLDNRSCKVKVIDPDDLPQRARWTIIATAFLLLVMCLLLVGVTLRMAPIIDDMERHFRTITSTP